MMGRSTPVGEDGHDGGNADHEGIGEEDGVHAGQPTAAAAALEDDLPDVEVLEAQIEQLHADCLNASEEAAYLRDVNERMRQTARLADQQAQRLEGENARLRAVVEAALNLGETDGMRDGKMPYPDWWVLLDRALDPRHHPSTRPAEST